MRKIIIAMLVFVPTLFLSSCYVTTATYPNNSYYYAGYTGYSPGYSSYYGWGGTGYRHAWYRNTAWRHGGWGHHGGWGYHRGWGGGHFGHRR